jgi:hypothetical protein
MAVQHGNLQRLHFALKEAFRGWGPSPFPACCKIILQNRRRAGTLNLRKWLPFLGLRVNMLRENCAQRYRPAMTDTTQADVLVPAFAPAAKTKSRPRLGYLFGPVFDFLTLGGGSLIVCGAIALLLPQGIPTLQQALLVTILMAAINQPHFAHSYQMFYRNFRQKAFGESYARALRVRYIIAGLIVPLTLIAFLTGSVLTGNVRTLALGANLMFFLVGWHYVKQGYGILIVDSVQKRLMFSDRAKTILRFNGYACWLVAWVGVNHALSQPNDYIGLTYFTLPLPNAVYYLAIVAAALTTLATLYVLAGQWRQKNGALPWNGVVAYLTTLYLWVIFVRVNPLVLAVIPTFHSLQYLAVVWRYQLNAGAKPVPARSMLSAFWPTGVLPNLAMFIGVGVLLGFVGFMGAPRVLDAVLPYDKHLFGPSLFLFSFYIFINVHHYFLDNVMWRRGNPDVQQYIFSRPSTASR